MTYKDDEILRAVDFLDRLSPDDRDEAFVKFITGLPSMYQRRAIQVIRQHNEGRVSGNASKQQPGNTTRTAARSGSAYRDSDVSGLGGVSSTYEPATQRSAQAIVDRYKSVPGGVTLEGDCPDLSFVKSAVYFSKANAFILNDDLVYVSPVDANDFSEINGALAIDDKLGVSLGDTPIVYGTLGAHGRVARNLKVADRFLGALVFNTGLIGDYRFAKGHNLAMGNSGPTAVSFNIHQVRFTADESGELKRSQLKLNSTLIPLSSALTPSGGRLPDNGRVGRGDVSPVHVENLRHLQDNIEYYAREKIMRTVISYGEVAAFARSLKAQNIKVEIK